MSTSSVSCHLGAAAIRLVAARRRLGTTDLEITRVGFGSLAMGGAQWVSGRGEQSEADSRRQRPRGRRGGINWIDTAPVYGRGLAEELVGSRAPGLRRKRTGPSSSRRPVSAGMTTIRAASRSAPGTRCASVGRSTTRCGAWGWSVSTFPDALAAARPATRSRTTGRSSPSSATPARCARSDCRITPSPNSRRPSGSRTSTRCSRRSRCSAGRAAADVIPASLANGTGVLAYAPMESGLLTGSFTAGTRCVTVGDRLAPEQPRAHRRGPATQPAGRGCAQRGRPRHAASPPARSPWPGPSPSMA